MADEPENTELEALTNDDDVTAEAADLMKEEPATEEASDEGSTETTSESTGEKKGATPAPETPDPTAQAPVAALLDERRKRQAAEAELEQLRAEKADPPPAAPDPRDDPQGAYEHLSLSVDAKVTQGVIKATRAMMMAQHDDFAEKEQTFMELAKSSPALVDEMLAADNPALFAYETATAHAEMQELKDVDAYKAKLRAEVEAEIRAEIEAQTEAGQEAAAKTAAATGVPSLSTAGGSSGTATPPTDDELSSVVMGHS